jgi:hypothetical protein
MRSQEHFFHEQRILGWLRAADASLLVGTLAMSMDSTSSFSPAYAAMSSFGHPVSAMLVQRGW